MFEYAFLPTGAGERFWAYGTVTCTVFRGFWFVSRCEAPAAADTKESPTDMCSSVAATSSADGVIAHIEQAVQPNAAQHEMLGQLRTALTQDSDRVKAACRATIPATPLERLDTMQDRIWAMRDAVLTVRMPLERFYNSLNEEQKARLNGGEPTEPDCRSGQLRASAPWRRCAASTRLRSAIPAPSNVPCGRAPNSARASLNCKCGWPDWPS